MEEGVAEELARTALCQDMTPDEIERIAASGRVEHWPAGAVVMEEGAAGPRLVVLLDGRVTVAKRDNAGFEHPLAEIGPGGIVGEMSLLARTPRTATVRATAPLRVFAMDRLTFDEMCADADPAALKLALSIARVLAWRLDRLNERLVELSDPNQPGDALREFAAWRNELFASWES